jgi:ATP-dependent DNA helicase RecG
MISEMENALLSRPQFLEREASFVVRLLGTTVFTAEDRLWISRFADHDLSAHAKVALVFARRNGSIGNEDLRNLRNLDRDASRGVLQGLVAMGLLRAVGRGRGARYVPGRSAASTARTTTLDEQLQAVLNHARRQGSIANVDVRGLLVEVDRQRARSILNELVGRGLLRAEGERRGRRYLPVHEGDRV